MDYCHLPSLSCQKRNNKYCTKFNPDQVNKYIDKNTILNKYKICYQNYPINGKSGDYICQINDNNQCIGKQIGCDKKKLPTDNYQKVDKKYLSSHMRICEKTEEDPKLYIDGKKFYQCQNDDEMCISNLYSANRKGLPVVQNQSDPPTRKILYTNTYDNPILNKNVITCPKGYNVCDKNMCCAENKSCVPIESEQLVDFPNVLVNNSPKLGAFESENECISWCAKNPECMSVVRFLDRNGNLQCRYYKYDLQENKINIVDDSTSKILNKRKHSYVPNPQLSL